MGFGIALKCASCGRREEVLLGVGMMYGSLGAVISEVPRRLRDAVLQALRSGSVEEIDYAHELLVCPRCETVHARFHFRVVHSGGQVVEPRYRCGDCGSTLARADQGTDEEGDCCVAIRRYRCRGCGNRSLGAEQSLLWD
jgi:DNA-directed RNA polymerase subunit RPC12/RpoP